ncbi:MAG: hypothetical protein IK015_12545 [Treponema sp.]|nr:hypothetical protein [Treponema sp.]
MGLLSIANGKRTGLSGTAAEGASELTFQQWAKQNGFERCGVFRSKNGLMLLECANGMDAQSVFSSISTRDFWNGSVRSDTWITLDVESPNFSAFTQFLGPEAKTKVKAFRIIKILDGDEMLVFFQYSFETSGFAAAKDSFKSELLEVIRCHRQSLLSEPNEKLVNELSQKGKVRLFLISTKRAFEDAIQKIEVCETTLLNILINTVFEELFYKTKKLFSTPAMIYSADPDEIKVAAIVNSEIEDEILKEQLSLEFADTIGVDAAKKIIILTAGYSDDNEEILDYLLRG